MIIAKRTLIARVESGEKEVIINIFIPKEYDGAWGCRTEIHWPDGVYESIIYGGDSVQSIDLALQNVGALLYFSDYHKSGQLRWGDNYKGYGFPVPKNARDLLFGDDARFYGLDDAVS